MTDKKFNEYNKIFRNLISEDDLTESKTLLYHESILSRVYKKNDNIINNDILTMLIVYNKHIQNEQYESAEKIKQIILKNYE